MMYSQEQIHSVDLWNKFKKGDKVAFEEIYRAHFSSLFDYGMTIANDDYLVKDAVQELFVDLWRYKENLSSTDSLKLYLRKSLRMKIYALLKDVKRTTIISENYAKISYEQLPSQENILIAQQEDLKKSKELTFLINELPPKQREVIFLIYFEERPYEEVANILSMNIQSVYTLVWKAISRIKSKMNKSIL